MWPADEIQLILQAMLLEEAGFAVQEIAAYYRAERRRVRVRLTSEMRGKAIQEVAAARETLTSNEPPLPLLDSPKCRGCSLNAICQPDEINALAGRSSWEWIQQKEASDEGEENAEVPDGLRRVVPMNADAQPLVVSIPGARVGIRKDSLTITPPELRLRKGEKAPEKETKPKVQKVGLSQISHVAIVGTAQMSSQALRACMDAGLAVSFSSTGGRVYGMASGEEPHGVYVRMAQHAAFPKEGPKPVAMAIAKALIADKIANQRVMLRRNIRALEGEDAEAPLARLAKLVQEIAEVEEPQTLLAKEGEAAKLYWKAFSKLCARDDGVFAMKGRTKRPPEDQTNAMISFCSGLLVRDCKLAVRAAQLDGQLGVFHTPHHGRPSMALDLMEPFRPLVIDSVVLGAIRRGEVQALGFVHTGQAVAMKQPTRRALIVAYERRMAELITHPTFGYRISYRQVLAVQARLLARVLVGELDVMPSFRTR
ncbi:MAG: CRISPR-associated endonuclease Cas1 [Deltaproteobacteria bacterium]|nr:CRISPR-associated endonuclease Cas1 [Deltaproteobacteria bacterium]